MINSYKNDRSIMKMAESELSDLISVIKSGNTPSDSDLINKIKSIQEKVHSCATSTIEYQVVVDHLDENIMITDGDQQILYVNPAFEYNFSLKREEIDGWTVSDLLKSGHYYTSSIIPDVIRLNRRLMRLAYFPNNERPSVVVGFPITDENDLPIYYVSSSRSLTAFADLREHFNSFMASLRTMNQVEKAIKVYESSKMISGEEPLIGNSPIMHQIHYMIDKVGDTDAPVLITGESGTGKELVANAVYNASKRKNKPFIKVNCSSIPATLIESELFGYEKGAFSGASTSGKKGLFEAANEGTILLDEIGDMPLEAQAKLLRVLQSNEITRVGGTKPIRLNIRVIASTNSNLKKKIQEGTFRKDLYYRLHIIPIYIPPLRERPEDIPLICQHFIDLFSARYNRSCELSEENMKLLCSYSWPGNIRELRNIMEYLVVCCSDFPYIDNSLLNGLLDQESETTDSVEESD